MNLQAIAEKIWYQKHPLALLLWPMSWPYRAAVALRRWFLCRFHQTHFPVPVIVVGNLTVGGVGKTPLVIALASQLRGKGLKVGIVSRGYGAKVTQFPYEVSAGDQAVDVGDEPLMMARAAGVPVMIAPKRVDAVKALLAGHAVDVVLSDDGLQHYAMGRSMEIVVIDGQRRFGNGLCLPAGPLREPLNRLKDADMVVVNGAKDTEAHGMQLATGKFIALEDGRQVEAGFFAQPVAAVAGIGHPQRFFNTLTALGVAHEAYVFRDHHPFSASDLQLKEKYIIMTEKDAMKCQAFAQKNWYYLPVEAQLDRRFWSQFWSHESLKDFSQS